MKDFVVRISFATPVALGHEPPALDSLLAGIIAAQYSEAAVDEVLPRTLKQTDGIYHASRLWLDASGAAFKHMQTRRSLNPAELLADRPWIHVRRWGSHNRLKAFQTETTAVLAPYGEFFGVGDIELVEALLALIPSLGKHRRAGFGRIASLSVDKAETTAAHGLLLQDGSPARNLPVEMYQRLGGRGGVLSHARCQPSYGYVLSPARACVAPAGFELTSRVRTQPESLADLQIGESAIDFIVQRIDRALHGSTPAETVDRFFTRGWDNRDPGKATRAFTEGDLIMVREEGITAVTNCVVPGVELIPRAQKSRDIFRALLAAPPQGRSVIVFKGKPGIDINLLRLNMGGKVLSVSRTSPRATFPVDCERITQAFAAVEGLMRFDIRRLAEAGDALQAGGNNWKALDKFGDNAVNIFEALPPRWSREWQLFLDLVPSEWIDDKQKEAVA